MSKEWENNPQTERKYLQVTRLVKKKNKKQPVIPNIQGTLKT